MKKQYLIIFILMILGQLAKAQAGYDWGENKPDAKQRWQYLNFLIEQKQYHQAMQPASWLFHHVPQLHEDLYKQTIKVFEKVEQKEVNQAYKKAIQDTILWLYDQRINYFGKEAYVLNRKGLVAYRYLSRRKGMVDSLYHFYSKVHELNGTKMYVSGAYSYMNATCDKKKFGGLDNEEVLMVYNHVVEVFDAHIATEANEKKKTALLKKKEKLDGKLVQCADVSCAFVLDKWGDSDDLGKQKLVFNILRANKCTSDPAYVTLATKILEAQPSASGYNDLGEELVKAGKWKEGISAYEKAVALDTDPSYQALILLKIANTYSKYDKNQSRVYAQKVVATGYHIDKAHTLIGNLYIASYDECKAKSDLEKRALFIAAYEEYKKAGNTKKSVEVRKNFPSKEEIFLLNKKVGDSIAVGCWINRTVQLQTRD